MRPPNCAAVAFLTARGPAVVPFRPCCARALLGMAPATPTESSLGFPNAGVCADDTRACSPASASFPLAAAAFWPGDSAARGLPR